MKKLMLVLGVCVAMVTGAWAEDAVEWFSEDAETVATAFASEGATRDGVWSNLTDQVEVADSKVEIDADDESAVAYRPNAALTDTNATIVLTDIVFDAARKTLPMLGENAQAAVAITTNGEGVCVFAVADGGRWTLTTTLADPGTSYAVKVDFAYAGGGNAASYAVSNETGWVSLKADAVNPKSEKITTVEFAGSGSFAALIGTCPLGVVAVTPGMPLGPFDTAEEATNMAKKAVLAPSAEVSEALGSDSARETYRNMFGFTVTGGGKSWFAEAMLYPEAWTNVVESAQDATRQIPVAAIAALEQGETMQVTVLDCGVPGFYYSFYSGSMVTNLRALAAEDGRNVLCAPDKTMKFSGVSKPSDAAGFFSIGVKETPGVMPSDHGIVVPGPVRIVPVR